MRKTAGSRSGSAQKECRSAALPSSKERYIYSPRKERANPQKQIWIIQINNSVDNGPKKPFFEGYDTSNFINSTKNGSKYIRLKFGKHLITQVCLNDVQSHQKIRGKANKQKAPKSPLCYFLHGSQRCAPC